MKNQRLCDYITFTVLVKRGGYGVEEAEERKEWKKIYPIVAEFLKFCPKVKVSLLNTSSRWGCSEKILVTSKNDSEPEGSLTFTGSYNTFRIGDYCTNITNPEAITRVSPLLPTILKVLKLSPSRQAAITRMLNNPKYTTKFIKAKLEGIYLADVYKV